MKNIFRYQVWQLLTGIILVVFVFVFWENYTKSNSYSVLGLYSNTWLWLTILIPILHQIYVVVVWRLEWYKQYFSARLGWQKAFRLFSIGFSILFTSRLFSIIILAISDKGTLMINSNIRYVISIIIFIPAIYLFYSVKKYFTLERAYGIDHFDRNYNKPYEKRGIFKYFNNAMYVFGLMILYLPGLLLSSELAILAAVFNHVFIWAHYFFTEIPDMKEIYGELPK